MHFNNCVIIIYHPYHLHFPLCLSLCLSLYLSLPLSHSLPPSSDSNIRILEDKCSSAEPEDDEEDADTEQDGDYEEKLKEEKLEDNDVAEGEEEDGVREKLKELIRIVEVCLMSNQGMQSTELTRASTNLLKTYQGT